MCMSKPTSKDIFVSVSFSFLEQKRHGEGSFYLRKTHTDEINCADLSNDWTFSDRFMS
jgi:hypothetical protein